MYSCYFIQLSKRQIIFSKLSVYLCVTKKCVFVCCYRVHFDAVRTVDARFRAFNEPQKRANVSFNDRKWISSVTKRMRRNLCEYRYLTCNITNQMSLLLASFFKSNKILNERQSSTLILYYHKLHCRFYLFSISLMWMFWLVCFE